MNRHERIPVRIRRRRREVNNIVSIELEAASGGPLPGFTAGSHIDLMLPGGLIRQYSLCSDPLDPTAYRIAVLLEHTSRGGSREVHALAVGQELYIGGPRNHFPLADDHESAVLIAGGIGVTPIMTMAQALDRDGIPFAFHYLTRSRGATAFRKELQASKFGANLQLRHDDEEGIPSPAELERRIGPPASGHHLYVCGPRPLIAACIAAADRAGWTEEAVHAEHFKAPDEHVSGDPVTLHLTRRGITVEVPGDRTLARALAEAGIEVPLSCEQGICGTCLVAVTGGTPDHRDSFLTEEERTRGDYIALCCSRSLSPSLSLDL
jgi:vanillate O-demethylase ferredoxin subunit